MHEIEIWWRRDVIILKNNEFLECGHQALWTEYNRHRFVQKIANVQNFDFFVPDVLNAMCLMSAFQKSFIFRKYNITCLSYFNLMHFGHIFAILSSFYRPSQSQPTSCIWFMFWPNCKKKAFFCKNHENSNFLKNRNIAPKCMRSKHDARLAWFSKSRGFKKVNFWFNLDIFSTFEPSKIDFLKNPLKWPRAAVRAPALHGMRAIRCGKFFWSFHKFIVWSLDTSLFVYSNLLQKKPI